MSGDTFLTAKQAYNAVTRRTKDVADAQLLQIKRKINSAIENLQYFCIFEEDILQPVRQLLELNGYSIYTVEDGYKISWNNVK